MSKFTKKDSARTHEEARKVVCCACGRKAKKGGISCVSPRFESLVCQYVYENFSVQNTYHPTAMCTTCRITLTAFEKVALLICYKTNNFI